MFKWGKFILLFILIFALGGCASTQTQSKRPVQSIYSLAAKRGTQQKTFAQTAGKVVGGVGKGCVWVLKELLSPLNGLRKGMINRFGVVSEETVVTGGNHPPSPYRNY